MLGTHVPSLLSHPYFLCHEWILAELQGAFWDPYCHEALAVGTSFLAAPFPLLAGESNKGPDDSSQSLAESLTWQKQTGW